MHSKFRITLEVKNRPITDTVNTLNFDNAIELKEYSYTEENVILTHSEKSELINESLKIEEN